MSDDWDIDSYKTEHENEEHWELRRNFMLTHKDKFPEDELVCLAQVFTNIEFMGCRYPDKTMIRVAELAKGVVEKFREKRKNSLKRTFVAASDAATAKVKGQIPKKEESDPPQKIKKMTFVEAKEPNEVKPVCDKINAESNSNYRVPRYGGVKTFNTNEMVRKSVIKKPEGVLGDLVLIFEGHNAISTIQQTASLNKCEIRWDISDRGLTKTCQLFLKDQPIGTGTGVTIKTSKEMAAQTGIATLRESCYGIRVKSKFFSNTTINPSQLGSHSQATPSKQLGEDNIGRKLMKMMGWEGGGLGNKGQGREEPVTASLHVRRDGLGLKSSTSTTNQFKSKARSYIKNWMKEGCRQDLVFSSDFNGEERKALHEVAACFSLKSRSYGKNANRHLVISRKSEPWEIVQELMQAGGSSDKYELLYPTKT